MGEGTPGGTTQGRSPGGESPVEGHVGEGSSNRRRGGGCPKQGITQTTVR